MKFKALIVSAAVLAAIVSCKTASTLPEDNWEPAVYEALTDMIAREGIQSGNYDPQCRPYAVFDYDNTTIINDITLTLMIYQIENLRYAFPPENAFEAFTAAIPDLDKVLDGPGLSARKLGEDIAADYKALNGMLKQGMELEQIHSTEEYLDFRAKLEALNEGVENTFDYATLCLWQPSLFSGMSCEELQNLTRESVDHWMAQDGISKELWESPDGIVAVEISKGLILPMESIHLYKTLKDNGFDIYVCSASLESVVEAMACAPQYGLGLTPDKVFGIRLEEEGYDQTFMEGKTACINKLIAPYHGGRAPSLVAGDSNGDYAMLTAFDDLSVGLVFDCKRSGNIAALVDKANTKMAAGTSTRPIYVVQPRDRFTNSR